MVSWAERVEACACLRSMWYGGWCVGLQVVSRDETGLQDEVMVVKVKSYIGMR